MIRIPTMLLLCMWMMGSLQAAPQPGRVVGGSQYEIPDWFKLSFLDLKEDASEAGKQNKGLMLFMHLDACPYCARMLDENFRQGENLAYIQQHFDVIAVNILGVRELSWRDGKRYTEKALAESLGVHFTPTIVFLDQTARKSYQLNGYRKPAAFRTIMEYVRSGKHQQMSLDQYKQSTQQAPVYTLRDNPRINPTTYLKGYERPLAILLEDRACHGCDEFHAKVLNHPEVIKELDQYLLIRLDSDANTPFVTPDGKLVSAKTFARDSGLDYRPGILLYNQGQERFRIDGRLYHFHFKEALRYVSGKHYLQYDNYNHYLAARQQALLKQGVNIDLAE